MSGEDGGGAAGAPAGDAGGSPAGEPGAAPGGVAENPAPGEAGEQAAAPPKPDPYRAAASGSVKLGGPDVGEAYQKSRRAFQTAGHGALLTRTRVGTFHLGDAITVQLGGRPARLGAGPVRPDELELIRGRYAKVPNYDRLLQLLRDRNLVLLRGVSGTGRTMTALHLLDAASSGQVFRLDTSQSVHLIGEDDVPAGSGQLAGLSTSDAALLTEMHLDRLSALLANKPCWMVLVVPHDFTPQPAVAAYLAECGRAEPTEILNRHLDWAIRDAGLAADAGADADLRALAASPAVRESLGPAPSPAEVMGLVELLAEHRHGRLAHSDLICRCAAFVDRVVTDWFDQDHDQRGDSADVARRLAGFRIALAVLNQSPYHLVVQAGEQLGNLLIRRRHPRREPGVPVLVAEHEGWLAGSRAHLVPGTLRIHGATVPCELAAFVDDRMPLAVLSQVWQHHHNVRQPIARWLRTLADDPRPFIWIRAAQAVGLLCGLDLPYGLEELIMPWVSAEDRPEDQLVASFALDQAARDPQIRPAVRALVDDWKDSEDLVLRRAAAQMLGREFGLADVERSLTGLLALGIWRDDDAGAPLLVDAARSVADLLKLGAVEPVTDRLGIWFRADRQAVANVALAATLTAAATKVADLLNIDLITAGAGRDRWPQLSGRGKWPLLLALAADDPRLVDPFVDLLWTTLELARSQSAALDVLSEWIDTGQRDRSSLTMLATFLHLLGDSRDSRKRLHHLIDTMRRRWERPLAADIADYLDAAIADPADGSASRLEPVRSGVS
jgi:hypothetical protein